MFLCFLPCFFGKAYLFVSPQLILLLFLFFQHCLPSELSLLFIFQIFLFNKPCLLLSLQPFMLLLLLRSLSYFKGKENPLFYLQPYILMFLWFMPFFFGKACLFIIIQLSPLLLLRFQTSVFNGKCIFFSLYPCVILLLSFQPSFLMRHASYSAFSHAYSSSSSLTYSLIYSTRRASSSASIHAGSCRSCGGNCAEVG